MGLTAHARITAAPDARGSTSLPLLAGDGPLALRRVRAYGTEARVCLVGAMSAPLGGDHLALTAAVEPGARLTLTSAAATIALPGRTGAPASYTIRITVGEDAELHWLPEPLIAAAGSRLDVITRIDLAPGARLLYREEQILGRTGEPPGSLTSRLTVRHAGRLLLDQHTGFGPGHPGWDGPAQLAGRRAVGQLLSTGPPVEPEGVRVTEDAVSVPLAGAGRLTTAVAADGLALRRLLTDLRPDAAPRTASANCAPRTAPSPRSRHAAPAAAADTPPP
ncbi:Urease accessory protein UreD [Streptomyces sp. RB5]|uniref:Urease accessory protein UreD n=1 Tax=Streptomyces smaragdinus TaxID=2585196 RepID=A0A7K0CML3_9ACTN|nr:urease accessory protein UreD [Streptomyces smaragdinus]MQY14720.1 Urease accessory protein UreD [Streptomyces smaragdinus]